VDSKIAYQQLGRKWIAEITCGWVSTHAQLTL